ncbi:MAG: hypothetical protein V9F04_01225 [Dermatophilaceae bacterium]
MSQPAIFVASIACWKGLLAKWQFGDGEVPIAASGGAQPGRVHALVVAGAMSFEEGLELVTLRGRRDAGARQKLRREAWSR